MTLFSIVYVSILITDILRINIRIRSTGFFSILSKTSLGLRRIFLCFVEITSLLHESIGDAKGRGRDRLRGASKRVK